MTLTRIARKKYCFAFSYVLNTFKNHFGETSQQIKEFLNTIHACTYFDTRFESMLGNQAADLFVVISHKF